MKSSIKKDTFKAIYRLLDKVSPINGDCGLLCGSACCTCENDSNPCNYIDSDSLGIYLLPGEDKLFSKKEDWLSWGRDRAEDYEFPDSWRGYVYFVKCKTAPKCRRHMRPMQCRTFPLAPHLDEDGRLYLIYQCEELPYECPLISEKIPLNPQFVKATYTAWSHLIRDSLIYDLVRLDSQYRVEDGKHIEVLYPL